MLLKLKGFFQLRRAKEMLKSAKNLCRISVEQFFCKERKRSCWLVQKIWTVVCTNQYWATTTI